MKTKDKILRILKKRGQVSIHELCELLGASRQYVHRMISELEDEKIVQKLGKAPLVYYSLIQIELEKETPIISYEKEQFLNQHFLLFYKVRLFFSFPNS